MLLRHQQTFCCLCSHTGNFGSGLWSARQALNKFQRSFFYSSFRHLSSAEEIFQKFLYSMYAKTRSMKPPSVSDAPFCELQLLLCATSMQGMASRCRQRTHPFFSMKSRNTACTTPCFDQNYNTCRHPFCTHDEITVIKRRSTPAAGKRRRRNRSLFPILTSC